MDNLGFTEEEIQRYARHITLPQVGGIGQRKLINSKVLVIGAGGLGFPCTALFSCSRCRYYWNYR